MQSSEPVNDRRRLLVSGIVCLVFSAVLIWHARYYMPFLSDDALISLRYLKRFLHGEGLTWTAGRPVEGYSNLLWILLLAIPGLFGADLIAAARILGIACSILVVISLLSWPTRSRASKQVVWIALVSGLLFYCLAAPTAVWAIGGLEQPLYACLIAVTISLGFSILETGELERKKIFAVSLALGLLCLTRPDGAIFTVAVLLALVFGWGISESRRRLRALLVLVSLPLLCYGGQTAFRLFYYGELVANTALVKIAPSLYHTSEGFRYVSRGFAGLAPFSYLAVFYLLASVWVRSARKRSGLLIICTGLWIAYLIVIGGDIFPAYRLFVPLLPVFAFALIEAMAAVQSFCLARNLPAWLMVPVLIACFVVYGKIQFNNPENRRAKTELWEWDGQVLGLFLKKAFGPQQPLVAVTAAGCIPYWSELPSLDMLGLTDYYLPRHPPSDLGQGYLGHELGDGKYVMDQKPDIITFHAGVRKPVFRSGKEMERSGDLARWYTPVNVVGTFPYVCRAAFWVRQESSKIGIRRTPDEVEIPAYLLSGNRASAARFNAQDKLVLPVSLKEAAGVNVLDPLPGDWTCEVVSQNSGAIDCKILPGGSTTSVQVTTNSLVPLEVEKVILRKAP
ncbi:MAG: arabinofuranosyltransferase [Verrucomicrobiota bacterium]